MKNRLLVCCICAVVLAIPSVPATAQDNSSNNVIVRDSRGLLDLQFICSTPLLGLGCKVLETVDGTIGNLFLVSPPAGVSAATLIDELLNLNLFGILSGIVDAEPDLILQVKQSQTAPSALYDTSPVSYYGTTVWHGYINQPAAQIINLQSAQNHFGVSGAGTVAVIDTGVDPTHPVLQAVLLQGRDFTRNTAGGSELADANVSSSEVNGTQAGQVNQSSMAVLDQQGLSTFSQPQYAAFGHGTMVAGIIHLVAPTAQIMPLKAFHADGTGKLSDVLRSIYYATQNSANILNMSFDFTSSSRELENAVDYAADQGVICVASVGNDGAQVVVYPAGFSNVMGIASTTNNDQLSSFSNYGQPPVWVGAPGEGIVTLYPFGTYAAGWGTSFSTPLVSGTAALLLNVNNRLNQQSAARAISHAVSISPSVGNGRLDVNQAVGCTAAGQC